MRLLKLNINNFGLFHNKIVEFSDGLNLIYGKNETGKSTIHGFIKGMLFGIKKSRGRPSVNDMYIKYQPWDRPGSFDGSMEFKVKGNTYHIYRNFNKDNKETSLTDIETGRKLNVSTQEFQELINGLTKAGYDGTISIEQLNVKTSDQLINVIQSHIANLTLTKSEEIDIKKALDNLKDKRKQLDIKSLQEEIEVLKHRIDEGNKIKQRIDEITKEIAQLQTEETELIKQKEALINNDYYTKKELENLFVKFPLIRMNYKYYLERLEESEQVKDKTISIQEEIDKAKSKFKSNLKKIKSDIDELDKYKSEYREIDSYVEKYEEEHKNVLSGSLRRNLIISCVFILIGLILTFLFFGINNLMFVIGASLLVIGIASFNVFYKSYKKKKNNYQNKRTNLKERQISLEKKVKDILKKYDFESDIELKNMYEQGIKDKESLLRLIKECQNYKEDYLSLQDKIKGSKEEILDYASKFYFIYPESLQNNFELSDSVIGRLEEYITDEQLKLKEYEEEIKPKIDKILSDRDKLMWELEKLEEDEEELEEDQEHFEQLMKKKKEAEEEEESINLAIDTIENLSINIHDTFGAELNNIASNLAKEITNGVYEEIKIDEKLNIKTEIEGQYQFLEKFSTGTIEQLYLSLRLAIADIVYGKGKVPILLDDTFAYYDDDRLRSTLQMLIEDSERQILLFTCHNREKEILDDLNASYNYIEL